jgi:monofunctional glycosyltransferase
LKIKVAVQIFLFVIQNIAMLCHFRRLFTLIFLCAIALQIYFLGRIGLMRVLNPQSTTFQRSEIKRLSGVDGPLRWQQTWVDTARISTHLKKAVVAAEDAQFVDHYGVQWDAVQQAWDKNQALEKRFEKRKKPSRPYAPKLIGSSTITQQLAKNIFLSSEKNWARKIQELMLTFLLEALLPKERILEIYLNSVEWGSGVFGAQAGAEHYFQTSAEKINVFSAARLAVMLPAPKRFETAPASDRLLHRAALIQSRMDDVQVP